MKNQRYVMRVFQSVEISISSKSDFTLTKTQKKKCYMPSNHENHSSDN
jgi:hypothetical protein